jgi:hypothetical protein
MQNYIGLYRREWRSKRENVIYGELKIQEKENRTKIKIVISIEIQKRYTSYTKHRLDSSTYYFIVINTSDILLYIEYDCDSGIPTLAFFKNRSKVINYVSFFKDTK